MLKEILTRRNWPERAAELAATRRAAFVHNPASHSNHYSAAVLRAVREHEPDAWLAECIGTVEDADVWLISFDDSLPSQRTGPARPPLLVYWVPHLLTVESAAWHLEHSEPGSWVDALDAISHPMTTEP